MSGPMSRFAGLTLSSSGKPGSFGTRVEFKPEETVFVDMNERARTARNEVIQDYARKTDKLGLYQDDWEQSKLTEHGDHKFTKRNAEDLLSNTLGGSTAQQHRDTRAGKLIMETTHFLAFEKSELSNGWNLTTTPNRKLTEEKHNTQADKSSKNTRVKTKLLKEYKNPMQTHNQTTAARREQKLCARAEAGVPIPPQLKTKAKPRTLLADLTCVQDLEFFVAPESPRLSPEHSETYQSPEEESRSPTPPFVEEPQAGEKAARLGETSTSDSGEVDILSSVPVV